MTIVMGEETRETIINDKGKDYDEEWISLPGSQWYKIGLVVSYNMGWQKWASGHFYSSRSGRYFVVAMHTKRIIDYVVYSMSCTECEFKPKDGR